jgi:hypothetical protein
MQFCPSSLKSYSFRQIFFPPSSSEPFRGPVLGLILVGPVYYVRYSAGHFYRALRSLILCVLSSFLPTDRSQSSEPYAVPTYLS